MPLLDFAKGLARALETPGCVTLTTKFKSLRVVEAAESHAVRPFVRATRFEVVKSPPKGPSKGGGETCKRGCLRGC